MAGDILLYQTDVVPVGDDQRQHIELTRDVAERFNSRYGETFTVPRGVYPETGAKVMDLQEPEKKMSTTGGTEQGTVFFLDEPDAVRRKFKSRGDRLGTRDRPRRRTKPGVSNLIEIMTVATGESIAEIESRYDGQGYGPFKDDVAEAVITLLEPYPGAVPGASLGHRRAPADARARRGEGPRGSLSPRSSRCTSAWASSGCRGPGSPSTRRSVTDEGEGEASLAPTRP